MLAAFLNRVVGGTTAIISQMISQSTEIECAIIWMNDTQFK